MSDVVSQATPFAERGRVSSRCNYWVVTEECNYQPLWLGNKMLTSAKHVTYCTPWQRMRSVKSADLIGHIKFLSWQQLDSCSVTRPFLSLQGVWLARLWVMWKTHPHTHTHTHKHICWWTGCWLALFPGSCPPMHEPGNEAIIWYTKL